MAGKEIPPRDNMSLLRGFRRQWEGGLLYIAAGEVGGVPPCTKIKAWVTISSPWKTLTKFQMVDMARFYILFCSAEPQYRLVNWWGEIPKLGRLARA